MSQSDELDELLFGSSTPKIITPPPSQSTSAPLTKPSNSASASSQPQQQQQQTSHPSSSSSSSRKENDEDIDVLLGTPSKNQNPPNQTPASSTSNQTKKNFIVTIIETVEEEGTVTPKFGDNGDSSPSDEKKKEEEPLVPPTTKEQILFTLIYAIAPVAALIVLLVLAYSGTTEGGTCKTQFQGTCAGLATGSGGWSAATIFSQLDSETNLGCPDPTQACVSPDISVRDLYADANYERCWNAPDSIWKTDYMMMSSSSTSSMTAVTSSTTTLVPTTTSTTSTSTTTTTADPNATTSTTTSSTSTTTSTTLVTSSTTSTTSTSTTPAPSSNSSKLGRIWIVPAINDLTDDNLNVTRALNCCRFLPGGTAGASVTQIIAKAVVGALIDILLNALMGIPIVAKIINVMMFPIDFVSLKLQSLLTMRKAKRKALKETALLERRGSTASLTELENSTTGSGHKENQPQEEEDFSKMVQNYAEKAAKDNEQMLQDLNLHSWVDEVCFPSTLMIIKSICLSIFGVYIAANETTKSDYDNSSAWTKYNAYASNIINGAVFSSWLDIGVQFFVFYSTQTDIFRRGVKIAALAPTIGMSYYVKFMFAPEKDHPAYKFFKFCSAARNGTLIIWLCYIAPYVTHICMAFFYYLPMISLYYMTMVQAGGLICCLVAKFFDIYGDNWREELLRKQRVEKAKKESAKKKKSSSSDKENDDAALQIATAGTTNNSTNHKEQEEKSLTVSSPRTANDAQPSSPVSEKKDLVMLKKTGSSNNLADLSNPADSVPLISASALFWGQIRTFIGRYLLMVMYSVLVFYVYSLCCNWAVLLYDDYDRYGGAKNYVLVVWEELSLRQMGCQILQLQDSIEKGDRLGTANNLFGFF